MNKDTMNSKNDWEGALASRFEEDIQLPLDENWTAIEQEIFPKNTKRYAALLKVASILLLGGIGMVIIQRMSDNDVKINAKNEAQEVLNKPKSSEKGPNSKPKQNTVLTEKGEHYEHLKSELKDNNQKTQFTSLPKKKGTLTKSKEITDNQKIKSILSTKGNLNQSKKNNQKSISLEQPPVNSEISSNITTEPTKSKDNALETIISNDFSNENSDDKSKNTDSVIRLNLIPLQLLSTTVLPPIKELTKKEKTDFKPYFSIQVAPLLGRNIRIISGIFQNDNTNSNALGDRRTSLPKIGFQTILNYHLNKRISLNTGFQLAGGDVQSRWFFKYLQVDPTTNDIRLKTTSGEVSTSDPTLIQSITNGTTGIYKLRINHAYSLLSIPVGITYRFTNQQFSPYIRSGFNLEFFVRRSLSLDVLENGMARNIELNLNRPNNRLNLQAMLALGVETQIKNKWVFFLEAGYYIPLNQFVNTNGYSVRIAGSSILAGFRYEIK
jgi:hypothetical protein